MSAYNKVIKLISSFLYIDISQLENKEYFQNIYNDYQCLGSNVKKKIFRYCLMVQTKEQEANIN